VTQLLNDPMTPNTAGVGARLGLAGTLEFKDAAGNVLKTVAFTGSLPLADTGLTADQAQALITQQEPKHGTDDCK
jgi:hypothetical protein